MTDKTEILKQLYDPGRGQDDEVRNTSSVQDDGGVVQNDEERLLKVIF